MQTALLSLYPLRHNPRSKAALLRILSLYPYKWALMLSCPETFMVYQLRTSVIIFIT